VEEGGGWGGGGTVRIGGLGTILMRLALTGGFTRKQEYTLSLSVATFQKWKKMIPAPVKHGFDQQAGITVNGPMSVLSSES